jgi:hypothetical protein
MTAGRVAPVGLQWIGHKTGSGKRTGMDDCHHNTVGRSTGMKFEHKALLLGGIAGALVGLAAAYLYVKSNERQIAAVEAGTTDALTKVSPREALSVGLSVVSLVRQIVGLGQAG